MIFFKSPENQPEKPKNQDKATPPTDANVSGGGNISSVVNEEKNQPEKPKNQDKATPPTDANTSGGDNTDSAISEEKNILEKAQNHNLENGDNNGKTTQTSNPEMSGHDSDSSHHDSIDPDSDNTHLDDANHSEDHMSEEYEDIHDTEPDLNDLSHYLDSTLDEHSHNTHEPVMFDEEDMRLHNSDHDTHSYNSYEPVTLDEKDYAAIHELKHMDDEHNKKTHISDWMSTTDFLNSFQDSINATNNREFNAVENHYPLLISNIKARFMVHIKKGKQNNTLIKFPSDRELLSGISKAEHLSELNFEMKVIPKHVHKEAQEHEHEKE